MDFIILARVCSCENTFLYATELQSILIDGPMVVQILKVFKYFPFTPVGR